MKTILMNTLLLVSVLGFSQVGHAEQFKFICGDEADFEKLIENVKTPFSLDDVAADYVAKETQKTRQYNENQIQFLNEDAKNRIQDEKEALQDDLAEQLAKCSPNGDIDWDELKKYNKDIYYKQSKIPSEVAEGLDKIGIDEDSKVGKAVMYVAEAVSVVDELPDEFKEALDVYKDDAKDAGKRGLLKKGGGIRLTAKQKDFVLEKHGTLNKTGVYVNLGVNGAYLIAEGTNIIYRILTGKKYETLGFNVGNMKVRNGEPFRINFGLFISKCPGTGKNRRHMTRDERRADKFVGTEKDMCRKVPMAGIYFRF